MSDYTPSEHQSKADEFAKQAERASIGFFREFFDLLRHNKKWWLLPLLVVILLMSFLIVFGGSVFAPFIYPFF